MTLYVSVCRIDRTSEGKKLAPLCGKGTWIVIFVARLTERKYHCEFYANLPVDVKRRLARLKNKKKRSKWRSTLNADTECKNRDKHFLFMRRLAKKGRES